MLKQVKRSGFTFIEMMLAVMMVGAVSIAVFGLIANGLRVWERTHIEAGFIDLHVMLQKLEEDCQNIVPLQEYLLEGDRTQLMFMAVVKEPDPANPFPYAVSRLVYTFDAAGKRMLRQQVDYTARGALQQPEPRTLARRIQQAEFSYYYFDAWRNQYEWSSVWPPEVPVARQLPLAVRLDVGMHSDTRGISVQDIRWTIPVRLEL